MLCKGWASFCLFCAVIFSPCAVWGRADRHVDIVWHSWAVSVCHQMCRHFPLQQAVPSCLWQGLLAPLEITPERAAVCRPPPEPWNWAVVDLSLEEFPTQPTWLSLTFRTWKPYHRWVCVSYDPLNSLQNIKHALHTWTMPRSLETVGSSWRWRRSSPFSPDHTVKPSLFWFSWEEAVLALCLDLSVYESV